MNDANASTKKETGDSNFKLAAIIIIVITIVASFGAFLLMVIPQEKQTFTTSDYDDPEDEDETANLSRKPESEELEGSETGIEIQKKAAFILTNGQMPTANIGKSFDWNTKYHTNAVSSYLKRLSASDKLSMIISTQITDATPISEEFLKKLEPKTCAALFFNNDCSKANLATYRGKVGIINKDSQTIANIYTNYFGQANDLSSTNGSCPKVVFDANLKKYVYSNFSCANPTSPNDRYYFYIYDYEADEELYYVYIAGAVYTKSGNASFPRTELFNGIDKNSGESRSIAKPSYFTINEDNYEKYDHYLMTFEKQNDNYVFKSFTTVNDY